MWTQVTPEASGDSCEKWSGEATATTYTPIFHRRANSFDSQQDTINISYMSQMFQQVLFEFWNVRSKEQFNSVVTPTNIFNVGAWFEPVSKHSIHAEATWYEVRFKVSKHLSLPPPCSFDSHPLFQSSPPNNRASTVKQTVKRKAFFRSACFYNAGMGFQMKNLECAEGDCINMLMQSQSVKIGCEQYLICVTMKSSKVNVDTEWTDTETELVLPSILYSSTIIKDAKW
jgi:hypothetical protein